MSRQSRNRIALLAVLAAGQACSWSWAQPVQAPPGGEPEAAPSTDLPPIKPFLDPALVPPRDITAVEPGGVCPDPRGGSVVYKNLVTGEVREFDPANIAEGAFDEDYEMGTFELGEDEHFMRNFGSLSEVSDPTLYPWRVNCKLIMEWYDSNGNFQGSGSCSGTLIDGRHVLTANHCTYDRDGWGWADRVYVYPAYDETDADPFGVSQSVGIIGWTGYVNNGDWNWDMSVVILDRPVGGITGWHGYGFNSGCSFFTGNTFHNASYPAESAYGFNGQQMYYRYGNFDACTETNLKKYNSLAYKGMSGSSAYYIDGNSNRYAYAVTSHRRPDGSADCDATWCTYLTAMWSDFFYYTRDTLIPGTYGNSVDFYPMWARTSSSTIDTGVPVGNFSYYCYNNSDASFNGTVWADIYLSTNDLISTGDKQLGSLGFNWGTGGRGSAFLSYDDLLVVPNDFIQEGWYYLGVIISNSDADNSNNDSSGQEAMHVYVDARPDLTPTSVDAEAGTYEPLDKLPVDVSVRNIGGDSSTGYNISVRVSTDTQITTSDRLIGTIDGGTIGAFQTESFSSMPQIPADLAPGAYYVGVTIAADRDEYSRSNNSGHDPFRIIVAEDCIADFNGDGVVNTQDFIAYLNAWSAKKPEADIDGNGVVNTQDFIAFLNLWNAGC